MEVEKEVEKEEGMCVSRTTQTRDTIRAIIVILRAVVRVGRGIERNCLQCSVLWLLMKPIVMFEW